MSKHKATRSRSRNVVKYPENTINFNEATPQVLNKSLELVPRTRNQEKLVLKLLDAKSSIVVAVGPAGTGKTYLAMQAAIKALKQKTCDRIVLTRPAVGVEDERHGFLPGNLVSKMEPWTRPLLDVLREYYRPREILDLIDEQVLEIAPLAFMRGRTFRNSWVIADEMQNATPSQVKMLMTRIGENSRIVITGDVEQTDRKTSDNGLLDLCQKLKQQSIDGLSVVELHSKDTQRHSIIPKILELYQN